MTYRPIVVETWPVAKLRPDPRNARKHSKRNLEAIAASLREFGQQTPIVVRPDGLVLKGNGTLEAARDLLGWSEVGVKVFDQEREARQRAYAIADNRTAELASWDDAMLLDDLVLVGADEERQLLDVTGFDEEERSELADSLRPAPQDDPDDVDFAAPQRVAAGERWVLGDHVLVCGDARHAETWKELGVEGIASFITDPPYGVIYRGDVKQQFAGKGFARKAIANDALDPERLGDLLRQVFERAYIAATDAATYYVFGPSGAELQLVELAALAASGWPLRHGLVWRKDRFVFGRADYHYQHESIAYGWKAGARHYFGGENNDATVLDFPRPQKSEEHPTMKPVALLEHLVRRALPRDRWVLDPFAGSGTTLIAAERLGRRCAAIELEPTYCDVIVDRWEKLTGKTAVRDG